MESIGPNGADMPASGEGIENFPPAGIGKVARGAR